MKTTNSFPVKVEISEDVPSGAGSSMRSSLWLAVTTSCFQEMMPRKSFAHNKFFGTALICGSSAVLLLGSPNTAKQIWTLFASANQLLAALTLLAATLWFVKKNRPTWITAIPMALMMSVSSTALGMLLWKSFAGDKIDWIKGGTATFLLALAIVLVVYAVRSLLRTKKQLGSVPSILSAKWQKG